MLSKGASLIVSACLVILAGCAQTGEFVLGSDEGEVNDEGLRKMEMGPFLESWVDTDVDYSKYNKLMLTEPYFEFRSVEQSDSERGKRSGKAKFSMDEATRVRLVEEVGKIYREELAKSTRFSIVDTAGPDVAIHRIGVFDIVSRVDPERRGEPQEYLSSVGEATLVAELRDSLSLEVIFRGFERRKVQRISSDLQYNLPAINWAEVRRRARRWAITMREGLDQIPG